MIFVVDLAESHAKSLVYCTSSNWTLVKGPMMNDKTLNDMIKH